MAIQALAHIFGVTSTSIQQQPVSFASENPTKGWDFIRLDWEACDKIGKVKRLMHLRRGWAINVLMWIAGSGGFRPGVWEEQSNRGGAKRFSLV